MYIAAALTEEANKNSTSTLPAQYKDSLYFKELSLVWSQMFHSTHRGGVLLELWQFCMYPFKATD